MTEYQEELLRRIEAHLCDLVAIGEELLKRDTLDRAAEPEPQPPAEDPA